MKFVKHILFIFFLTLSFANAADNDSVELNFVNTPIAHLTKLISELTGNNFIADGEIPGNFTFVSQKPVQKKHLMSIYEMILRTKGYMIVNHEDKGFFMIVKNNAAQRENIEFDVKENQYEIKTEIIPLRYFTPSKITAIVNPYFTPAGKVVANDELNFIMLTDYHDAIQKVKKIIERIDTQENTEITWVKLNYINTKNVFKQITELTKKVATKYRQSAEVLEDKASNSVIIVSTPLIKEELVSLVTKIDEESRKNSQSAVIYLKNSKAADIVKIIQEMEKVRYEGGDISDKEKAAIAHDVSLNAIIIMAEQSVINTYKTIIEDLDKPKKQVFVKAKIVEINEDRAKDIGLELDDLLLGDVSNNGAWSVVGNVNTASLTTPALSLLSSVTGADLQEATNGISFGVIINLLESEGIAKILSSPTLLCLDNQESSIYVGEVQPVQTSVSQQSSTTTVPVTTYQYKDIGLELKVKPQIMSDDKVRLDIANKLEEIVQGSANLLPTTTKREVKSTSIVKNGDSVVIAGLIKTKNDVTETKIPVLGDLPFLGPIFRNEDRKIQRVNLLIILTPHVVSNSEELATNSKLIQDDFFMHNKKVLSKNPEMEPEEPVEED